MAKRIIVEPKHEKVAIALEREQANGTSRAQAAVRALKAAGYADKQARKGWNLINQTGGIQMAMRRRAAKILGLEKETVEQMQGPELWEALIEWRLQQNIMRGEDKAVQSAKLLGNHKKLGLWNPDVIIGTHLSELSPQVNRLLDEIGEEKRQHEDATDTYEVRDPQGGLTVIAVPKGTPLPAGVVRRVTESDDFQVSNGVMCMSEIGRLRHRALQEFDRQCVTSC
jgi:hypothetical protein